MLYSGIDLHKRFSVISTMDDKGDIVSQAKVKNKPELLLQYFNNLDNSSAHAHKAVIEATFAWGWLADLLENSKIKVMLAHPQKTKAIASAKVKTDKVDADTLAHLLRTDFVAPAHYTDKEIRDKQEILRTRAKLVSTRTSLKNKVHSILHKHNLNPEWDKKNFTDLFGKKGRAWMESKIASLPPHTSFCFAQLLTSIDNFKAQIKEFDKEIKAAWQQDDNAKLLESLPGIGYYGSLILSSEIGDIKRFASPGRLCSYAGLVPAVYQSGDKRRMGRLKKGNKYIRWILIEAVPKAIKKDKRLNAFYTKTARTAGSKKAKIAAARKMLCQIHLILRRKEAFIQEPGIPAFFSDQHPVKAVKG
jgi:transposase